MVLTNGELLDLAVKDQLPWDAIKFFLGDKPIVKAGRVDMACIGQVEAKLRVGIDCLNWCIQQY
jgi:hypothetical protein